jgi:hypothetical protein
VEVRVPAMGPRCGGRCEGGMGRGDFSPAMAPDAITGRAYPEELDMAWRW